MSRTEQHHAVHLWDSSHLKAVRNHLEGLDQFIVVGVANAERSGIPASRWEACQPLQLRVGLGGFDGS